jgi:LemA protein
MVTEAWADVDVQLKRRHDLIPSLVNIVKGYANHEKALLEKITSERTTAITLDKKNIKELSSLENSIESHLHSIFALTEAYPDLKANENYLKLQEDLVETEDEIASSRRIYNANVGNYNTNIGKFPQDVIASLTNFKLVNFFQKEE